MDNLNTFLEVLNSGVAPEKIRRGFIHVEPKGILAFDESGPNLPRSHKALRLNVYPDIDRKILLVINLGEKTLQKKDIKEAVVLLEQYLLETPDDEEMSSESEERK